MIFNYITTNLINGKQYIGMHSTNNINDGYLGGGLLIGKAIKKYGKENFKRKIINKAYTIEQAHKNEKFLIEVFETLVPNGYNISPTGGLNVPNCFSEETKQKIGKANGKIVAGKIWIYNEKLNKEKLVVKENLNHLLNNEWILGRKPYTEEHIKNMSKGQKGIFPSKEATQKNKEANSGENNPNYGKKWIYNGKLNEQKSIKKEEIKKYLEMGYRLGMRPLSKEQCKSISEAQMSRIYIYSENKEKRVKEEYLSYYLEHGWELGRIKKRKRRKINK